MLAKGSVFASVDLFPSPIVADQVVYAFAVLGPVVARFAGQLRAELGNGPLRGNVPASSARN